jgi:hypothetical protein
MFMDKLCEDRGAAWKEYVDSGAWLAEPLPKEDAWFLSYAKSCQTINIAEAFDLLKKALSEATAPEDRETVLVAAMARSLFRESPEHFITVASDVFFTFEDRVIITEKCCGRMLAAACYFLDQKEYAGAIRVLRIFASKALLADEPDTLNTLFENICYLSQRFPAGELDSQMHSLLAIAWNARLASLAMQMNVQPSHFDPVVRHYVAMSERLGFADRSGEAIRLRKWSGSFESIRFLPLLAASVALASDEANVGTKQWLLALFSGWGRLHTGLLSRLRVDPFEVEKRIIVSTSSDVSDHLIWKACSIAASQSRNLVTSFDVLCACACREPLVGILKEFKIDANMLSEQGREFGLKSEEIVQKVKPFGSRWINSN